MVALDIRHGQLVRLIETLRDVLAILRCDDQCQWTHQFEQLLRTAKKLAADGFTQDQLDDFSRSVCHVFDKYRGGFFQYRPPANLPEIENFETFARVAYDRALELRVVGRD